MKSASVNCVFHGLWFLEYVNSNLILTAPVVDDHMYFIGVPDGGSKLAEMPKNQERDLTGLLRGNNGARKGLPKSLPQFSRRETGIGNTIEEKARFRVILPPPIKFSSLRIGSICDFHPHEESLVGKSIKKHSGPELGIATCLTYEGDFPPEWQIVGENCHLYAENQFEMGLEHVNGALQQASDLFDQSRGTKKFDLAMDRRFALPQILPQEPNPRLKLDPESEETLAEVLGNGQMNMHGPGDDAKMGANVANCCQYGILP